MIVILLQCESRLSLQSICVSKLGPSLPPLDYYQLYCSSDIKEVKQTACRKLEDFRAPFIKLHASVCCEDLSVVWERTARLTITLKPL